GWQAALLRRMPGSSSWSGAYRCLQAEDGIRDRNVTGVQTCALPISRIADIGAGTGKFAQPLIEAGMNVTCVEPNRDMLGVLSSRSEERRVGRDGGAAQAGRHEEVGGVARGVGTARGRTEPTDGDSGE